MNNNLNRRNFLKLGASATAGIVFGGLNFINKTNAQNKSLRLGFVGVGGRGSYHLDCALGMEGIDVPAICDIKTDNLYRAKKWIEDAGKPSPRLYGKSRTDFVRMMENEELDCVICSTSWEWHAPVCISAMKTNKHAVSEVPLMLTIDEAWEIVETYEKTGKWATLGLEQAFLEGANNLSLYKMVRDGIFGDIIHCESGYVHDLRLVKFDPEREPWRLQHSIERNGNLYPDHPMSKFIPLMDINHGDRIDFLVSMSSSAKMLNMFADLNYGPDHPYANKKVNLGDYNASLIRTVKGKMITINHDTSTPHPREFFRMQGTKGIFFASPGVGNLIYLDGISPEMDEWEPADKYFKDFEHPIYKNFNPPPRQALRGHGSGSVKTPLTWFLLVKALRENKPPVCDVYDSVISSAISPLSEMSVANKSNPVDCPDFTRGKWQTRPPIDIVIEESQKK